MPHTDRPHVVIGASRGPGLLIARALAEAGCPVTGIARSRPADAKFEFHCLDATDTTALMDHIPDQAVLVHASRPEFLTMLLDSTPPISRLVALGSTRIYTRYPDDKCQRVTAMADAITRCSIPTTLLHPTMIYGAPGLNNIERIVHYARLTGLVPLPNQGRALIQPVYAPDLVETVLACLQNDSTVGQTYVVPGGEAISYRAFVELCARTAGLRCRVVNLPLPLLRAAAFVTGLLPFLPGINQEEIQRLTEDKAFDTSDAEKLIGRSLLTLPEGLPRALDRIAAHSPGAQNALD